MENTFKSFLAPSRILLGPGPATVNPRVLKALSQPTLGHLDPNVISMMDEIKAMLRNSFLTENEHTFVISAPGSVGMEFSFVNLIEPGEKVIICTNGYFGDRMKQVAERSGAEVVVVAGEWGKPLDIENLKITLKYNPDTKFVGFVSSETSTGVRNDTKALFRVDEWGVDMAYSCSQKGRGSVPGMSPVTISPLAVEKIKNRKTPITSWFLDLNNLWPYWGSFEKRAYHHTAPVNSFYALHESLVILMEEGLENSWSRHTRNHLYLSDAMATLGLEFYVEAPYRLPQLNTILLKEGMDDAAIRKSLLLDYGIEVGAD